MKFGIFTHAVHKKTLDEVYAYEPYVREMNLWTKHFDEVIILAPISKEKVSKIDLAYKHSNLRVAIVPNFDITSIKNLTKAVLVIPRICMGMFKLMKEVDHIHIRCPGNLGLLACFIQILFPKKIKTVKYAGNWDPKSKQPLTYRIQRYILSNTFLTRNIKVLVYGEWENQSKNIKPFFTATYSKNDIVPLKIKTLENSLNFIFVGTFSKGKQPLLSVMVIEALLLSGLDVYLDMYGEGAEFSNVQQYIKNNSLENNITLHGNQSKYTVKNAYKKAHFLLFISKSEGWPKVVAEAMFWQCLPIASNVSCVSYMLGNGSRGIILESEVKKGCIIEVIKRIITKEAAYQVKVNNAKKWSQNYVLEKFELEIEKLLQDV